jgi:predicted site-specific integrase-resolvase
MTAEKVSEAYRYPDEMELPQACEFLGIAVRTMYNRIREGTAPARFKENGRWKFRRLDLEAYKKAQREHFKAYQ